jgi:hypothetical protein
MELWVRSQDKECLLKINRVDIDTNGRTIMVNGFESIIGIYKSKQRALEILDEIQNILKPKMIVNTYKVEQAELCDGTQFIQPMLDDIQVQETTSYVYEMPSE